MPYTSETKNTIRNLIVEVLKTHGPLKFGFMMHELSILCTQKQNNQELWLFGDGIDLPLLFASSQESWNLSYELVNNLIKDKIINQREAEEERLLVLL